MRICKIWDADYPWDIRVEKVTDSLAEAGHEVHLVCRNGGRLKRTEWTGKFQIHRLPVLPRVLGVLHQASNFPHPANPMWWKEIGTVVWRHEIDLILVRDLPLAFTAGVLGKVFRIPVVLDMAENYPAMLADRLRYTPTGILGRLVRQPALARLIEHLSLPLMDHVIVVVRQSRDRLQAVGMKETKLTVVTNTPRIDQWEEPLLPKSDLGGEGPLHAVYLGNLDGSRGVDTAIQGIAHLKHEGFLARLTIIGQGPYSSKLEELIRSEGLGDRVSLTGRLRFRDIQNIMAESHVGIIPHYSTEAWNTTMPNKLFDYMWWGIPVLVSDIPAVSSIVREVGCGVVFRDRDPIDFARRLMEMQLASARAEMGEKGRQAVLQRYNWKFDGGNLVHCIEEVARSYHHA